VDQFRRHIHQQADEAQRPDRGGNPAGVAIHGQHGGGVAVAPGQERLRFLPALEDMRRDAARGERLAELGAQEGAGGVAGDLTEVIGQEVAVHLGVGVVHVLVDAKTVVVDDHADPLAGRPAAQLADIPDRLHVLGDPHVHALEIEEQDVALRIVDDPFRQGQVEQFSLQAHRVGIEDARIHLAVFADDRLEVHVRQNVPVDVDARRHLDQRQPPPTRRNTQRSVT
jgi:hypothetical protein